MGATCEGLWSAYFTIMGEALVQIPTQKRPFPIERDKPVRVLFMKFHFIPPWQPFKQWLWGNVPPRMSNNSRDQRLFCIANTLIKKEWKSSFLKALNTLYERHLQNKTQTKGYCPKDAIVVSYHNQYSLYDAIHRKHDTFGLLPLILDILQDML